jgi:hypothetical protein
VNPSLSPSQPRPVLSRSDDRSASHRGQLRSACAYFSGTRAGSAHPVLLGSDWPIPARECVRRKDGMQGVGVVGRGRAGAGGASRGWAWPGGAGLCKAQEHRCEERTLASGGPGPRGRGCGAGQQSAGRQVSLSFLARCGACWLPSAVPDHGSAIVGRSLTLSWSLACGTGLPTAPRWGTRAEAGSRICVMVSEADSEAPELQGSKRTPCLRAWMGVSSVSEGSGDWELFPGGFSFRNCKVPKDWSLGAGVGGNCRKKQG